MVNEGRAETNDEIIRDMLFHTPANTNREGHVPNYVRFLVRDAADVNEGLARTIAELLQSQDHDSLTIGYYAMDQRQAAEIYGNVASLLARDIFSGPILGLKVICETQFIHTKRDVIEWGQVGNTAYVASINQPYSLRGKRTIIHGSQFAFVNPEHTIASFIDESCRPTNNRGPGAPHFYYFSTCGTGTDGEEDEFHRQMSQYFADDKVLTIDLRGPV